MSDQYNLDDDVSESFTFQLKGNVYEMRYPTTEEIQEGSSIKDPTKQMDWLYGFVKAQNGEAPDIKEALQKVNVKTLQKFNSMIKGEFMSSDM